MNGWQLVKLGTLASFRNGLNFSAAARGSGLAIVGVGDFRDRSFVDFSQLEELVPTALNSAESLIREGDVLFVRSNGNRALIGRSMFVSEVPPMPTTHSGFTIRMRFTDNRAFPKFFAYLVRGPLIRNLLSSQGGGTSINNLNQDVLARLDVPLPTLHEQRRIASILGAYDDLIEVNRRRIALMDDMARSLFEEWFVRFRFPGHEAVAIIQTPDGPLPDGWNWCELGDLVEFSYGKALKATARVAGTTPVFGSSGIVGWHNEAFVCGPGIIVGRKGNVGSVSWSSRDFWPIDTVFYVRSDLPLSFLFQMLRRLPFQNSDAAVPGLNRNAALKLTLAQPPLYLLRQYASAVEAPRALLESLEQTNEKLTASRDLLLPRLISGDLSVTAAERELEDAA